MKKYIIYPLLYNLLAITLSYSAPLSKDVIKSSTNEIKVDYDSRLAFYLDMKTKRFLKKMSLKEAFLLSLIENINEEIKSRGKKRLSNQDVGFDIIYGENEKLITSYSQEINEIIAIIREIEKLELIIQRGNDIKLLTEAEELKDHLTQVLDTQKMKQSTMTKQQVASMIHEYSTEVEALLKLYEGIEDFEKKASIMGDSEIMNQLQNQKKRIIKTLELTRILGPETDKVVEEYINETTNLVTLLKELDKLEIDVGNDSLSVSIDIDTVRKNIINNVDDRILDLFGYALESKQQHKVTLADYFKEWKAERIASYQIKITQYRVIRDQLIKTAHPWERDRMLERELQCALLNYADNNYELALVQFEEILDHYIDYYPKLDAVYYYKNEANFALGYYDEAYEGMTKLIEQYPTSPSLGKTYFRLMYICYTYGWYNKFFNYYEKLTTESKLNTGDFDEAQYLAGFIYFKQKEYISSEKVLMNILERSRYYLPAQYLLGVVYLNLDEYSKGKLIFEKIVAIRDFAPTDLNSMIIRNDALLKLGYLHYQRGEYVKAQTYFEQISGGYDKYDSSLMGQAWVNLKKGEFDESIQKVDILTSNYLMSNYTYEGLVLSAHCKKIKKDIGGALNDLQYVANSKKAMDKAKIYNDERKNILAQMDEVSRLEENILERQDRNLYPQVMKIRKLINDALVSYYYRGSLSSRVYEGYNDERRVLISQIEEFENILKFAEEQNNAKMYRDAKEQRDRLLLLLDAHPVDKLSTDINYFIDYPLATKESGIVYQKDVVKKVFNDLLLEKKRVKSDLDMILNLASSSDATTQMEVVMDLEILEEDLEDLHNQLNKFQVWLANHQVPDVQTAADYWADFSGFGISDINFTNYYETNQKINVLSKNITYITDVLKKKRETLEERIYDFDNEVLKIQNEMEAEKIRLEKLEKEKYFRDSYFDTKVKEVEAQTESSLDYDDQSK